MVTSSSCSAVSATSTESGTISPMASDARQSRRKSRITSSDRSAAEDDLLAQVGQRVGDELRLRRHHLERDVGELRPELRPRLARCASVTATVLEPASL